MALSSKLTEIRIRDIDVTWRYRFKVKDLSMDIGQVNYGAAYDEAIDGSLRTNIRGFRMTVNLPLNKLYDSLVYEEVGTSTAQLTDFLDDMIDALVTDGEEYIEVSFDNTNWHKVIPDATSYGVSYTNQIARGQGSITLIGQEILPVNIPSSLQAPSV
jgi:hypothetical protein